MYYVPDPILGSMDSAIKTKSSGLGWLIRGKGIIKPKAKYIVC